MQNTEFINGYIEAILFCNQDEKERYWDSYLSQADFAPKTMEKIENDCAAFIAKTNHIIMPNWEQAGIDFYLTRCGHGTGFWDRPEIWCDKGGMLSVIATSFGAVWFYIGDDNLIYC